MRQISSLVTQEGAMLAGLTLDVQEAANYSFHIDSYKIPENEQVLCYAGSKDSTCGHLTGAGPIITDEAIYIHPSRQKYTSTGRIPLSDLCEYLIYESQQKNVSLVGRNKKYQIFVYTKSEKSSTAASLVSLLSKLQESMMLDKKDRISFFTTLKHICALGRVTLHKQGVLDDEFKSILSVVEKFPEFRREAVFMQLEDVYRRCDRAVYDIYLESKASLLNEDNIRVLKNPDEFFYHAFALDLASDDGFSDIKAVIDAYLVLKNNKEFSLRQIQILMYLCIRMGDYDYFNELMGLAGDDMPSRDMWEIFSCFSRHKNTKVNKLQVQIVNKKKIAGNDYLEKNDLGFCSIHFALMLRNKDIIRALLPCADWSEYKSYLPKDKMCDMMYQPMFIASYIYNDDSLLRDVFIYTSPKAKSLVKSIASLEALIDINVSLRHKYPQGKKEYTAQIEEYKSYKKDMHGELKKMARDEAKRCRRLATIIRETRHPVCEFLFGLYESQEAVISYLKQTQEVFRLCRYKNMFFATPKMSDIDLSNIIWDSNSIQETNVSKNESGYTGASRFCEASLNLRFDNPVYIRNQVAKREAQRKADEERAKRRQEFYERMQKSQEYEGSWFSRDAHRDIRTLKSEYRVLVKKYHPDSSRDNTSSAILMRIMAERADILEKMRSNT